MNKEVEEAISDKDKRIKELIYECDVLYEESQRDKAKLVRIDKIMKAYTPKVYKLTRILEILEEE